MVQQSVKTITLRVKGTTCSMCPQRIRKALEDEVGILEVKVAFKRKSATVRYDTNQTTLEKILKSRAFVEPFRVEHSDASVMVHRYEATLLK